MAFNITEVFHKTKENIYLKEQEFSSFKANKPWLFSPKFSCISENELKELLEMRRK